MKTSYSGSSTPVRMGNKENLPGVSTPSNLRAPTAMKAPRRQSIGETSRRLSLGATTKSNYNSAAPPPKVPVKKTATSEVRL